MNAVERGGSSKVGGLLCFYDARELGLGYFLRCRNLEGFPRFARIGNQQTLGKPCGIATSTATACDGSFFLIVRSKSMVNCRYASR